jgi:hypothetical protein
MGLSPRRCERIVSLCVGGRVHGYPRPVRLKPLHAFAVLAVTAAVLGASAAPAATSARPRVTLIGDSVAASLTFVPQARALLGRGVELELDAKVCRRLVGTSCPYRGSRPTNTLDAIADTKRLGEVVVIDVGYNDDPSEYTAGIDPVMRALVARGAETVIWATLKEDRPAYRAINDAIRKKAKQWSQMKIADWDRYSRSHAAWFVSDGLHVNAAGALGIARMLRPEVALAACLHGCPRLPSA